MARYLGLLVLAAAALAEERPLSDLQTLKWQVEAQARERSRARRVDFQGETARPAPRVLGIAEFRLEVTGRRGLIRGAADAARSPGAIHWNGDPGDGSDRIPLPARKKPSL